MKKLMCLLVVLAFASGASADLLNGNIVAASEDSIQTSWTTGTAWDLVNGNGFQSGTSGAGGLHSVADDVDGTWTGGGAIDKADPGLTTAGKGWVKYEFDQVYTLDKLRIWNHTEEWNWTSWTYGFGAKDIILGTSVNGTTWTETAINGLNNGTGKGWNIGYPGEEAYTDEIALPNLTAKYVAITIIETYDAGIEAQIQGRCALAEVQFEGVPEPATIALLGLGGLALVRRGKR